MAKLNRELVNAVKKSGRLAEEAIAQINVPFQKDPLPGHQYVVEDGDGVHLFIARAERIISGATAGVETLAADKAQSRRRHWYGEGKGKPGASLCCVRDGDGKTYSSSA